MTRSMVLVLAAATAMLVVTAIALAHGGDATAIHSCVTTQSGAIRIVSPDTQCKGGQTALDWNVQGPQGVSGPSGPSGPAGPPDPAVAAFVERFGSPAGGAVASSTDLGDCLMGTMILTASEFLPEAFTPADGRLLPINQNQALFSLLEFRYGGDGIVRFALPDLRAIAPDHMTYGICTEGIFPATP
jgi:hypothetical protein